MTTQQYTPDEVKDIQEREAKALEMLKELELTPSAMLHLVNTGDDVFATKVVPYLQDIKYKKDQSPSTVEPKTDADAAA